MGREIFVSQALLEKLPTQYLATETKVLVAKVLTGGGRVEPIMIRAIESINNCIAGLHGERRVNLREIETARFVGECLVMLEGAKITDVAKKQKISAVVRAAGIDSSLAALTKLCNESAGKHRRIVRLMANVTLVELGDYGLDVCTDAQMAAMISDCCNVLMRKYGQYNRSYGEWSSRIYEEVLEQLNRLDTLAGGLLERNDGFIERTVQMLVARGRDGEVATDGGYNSGYILSALKLAADRGSSDSCEDLIGYWVSVGAVEDRFIRSELIDLVEEDE